MSRLGGFQPIGFQTGIVTYGNLDLAGSPENRRKIDTYFAGVAEETRRMKEELAARQARDQEARNQAALMQNQAAINAGQSVLDAQLQGGLEAQRAGFTERRDANQAAYEAQRGERGFQQQQQLMGQQEGIQARTDERRTGLQARLNEITLTQSEEIRRQRMRSAVADVRANPNLSDDEKEMLITQIQTGLNPLENRLRETQEIHTRMQTESLYQANQQQAELFNQQQAIRAMRPEDRIRMLEGPDGRRAMFQMDDRGNWSPLDFGAAERADQAHTLGMIGQAQQIGQREEMFPLQRRGAELGNQQAAFNLDRGQQMLPMELIGMSLNNETREQALGFAREMQPLQLQQLENTISGQLQSLRFNDQMQPIERDRAIQSLERAQLDFQQAALEGPLRLQHQGAILTQLQNTNAFDLAANPDRLRQLSGNVEALRLANERDSAILPATVQRANLALQALSDDLQHNRTIRPHLVEQARMELGNMQEARAGQWLRNTAGVLGLLGGGAMGGAGQLRGPGGVGGVGGQRALTPAQAQQINSQIARDVNDENRRRRERQEDIMSDTEQSAYEAARREYHVNGIQAVMQELGGQSMSPAQAEALWQRIENAPPDIRESLFGPRGQGQQPQGQGQMGPPQPPQQSTPAARRTARVEPLNRLRYEAGQIFDRGNLWERSPIAAGEVPNVGSLYNILDEAVRSNEPLTDAQRRQYEEVWATLSDDNRSRLQLPDQRFVGTPERVNEMLSSLEASGNRVAPIYYHRIRAILQRVSAQGRGFTPSEVEAVRYWVGRMDRRLHGRLMDELDIGE